MAVVSVKVSKEIKEKMKKTEGKVNWPEEIRRSILGKIEELERRETVERVERSLAELPVQPKGTVTALVREDRDTH